MVKENRMKKKWDQILLLNIFWTEGGLLLWLCVFNFDERAAKLSVMFKVERLWRVLLVYFKLMKAFVLYSCRYYKQYWICYVHFFRRDGTQKSLKYPYHWSIHTFRATSTFHIYVTENVSSPKICIWWFSSFVNYQT